MQNLYEINVKEKINKLKELWKNVDFMGFPYKGASVSKICLKGKNEILLYKNCILL